MNPWMVSEGVLEEHYWANQEELDKQMVSDYKLPSRVKTGSVVPVSYATCPSQGRYPEMGISCLPVLFRYFLSWQLCFLHI